jgi:predicted kinase
MKKYKYILIAGISGSGKSHYSKELAVQIGATIISSDDIRRELTGSQSNFEADSYMWRTVIPQRIREALLKGHCIMDSTGYTKKLRKPLIEYGMEMDAWIEAHYFENDLSRAIKQNQLRERVVPLEVLERQSARWVTPTLDEGFNLVLNIDQERRDLEEKRKIALDELTRHTQDLVIY